MTSRSVLRGKEWDQIGQFLDIIALHLGGRGLEVNLEE